LEDFVFKRVEFKGFEGLSELLHQAERATTVLGDVIRSWRDEVEVIWRPAPLNSGAILEVTLSLTLWNASDSATNFIPSRDFDPGEDAALRSDLRDVWSKLLAQLSDHQMKRLDEILREPAEV
jgi:hypothetical protein